MVRRKDFRGKGETKSWCENERRKDFQGRGDPSFFKKCKKNQGKNW